MLYIFQFGLLNKMLLSWWCVTCTHIRLPQDWCTSPCPMPHKSSSHPSILLLWDQL